MNREASHGYTDTTSTSYHLLIGPPARRFAVSAEMIAFNSMKWLYWHPYSIDARSEAWASLVTFLKPHSSSGAGMGTEA